MKTSGRRLTWTFAAIVGVLGATVTAVQAQRIWAGYYGRTPPKFPTATTFDGNFHFCRVMFTSNRREKQGWSTDYPGADINLSVRLSELTKIRSVRSTYWTLFAMIVITIGISALLSWGRIQDYASQPAVVQLFISIAPAPLGGPAPSTHVAP